MKYSSKDILLHIDYIIDRQQEDLDELSKLKPLPISQLQKTRYQLANLRLFRKDLNNGNPDTRILTSIVNDMQEFGW